jgi:hypothetical protein
MQQQPGHGVGLQDREKRRPCNTLPYPTAAGLQGAQPLVDGTRQVREVGKMDP